MYSTTSTQRPSLLGRSPRMAGKPGRRLVANCAAMKSMHMAIAGATGVRRCCAIVRNWDRRTYLDRLSGKIAMCLRYLNRN